MCESHRTLGVEREADVPVRTKKKPESHHSGETITTTAASTVQPVISDSRSSTHTEALTITGLVTPVAPPQTLTVTPLIPNKQAPAPVQPVISDTKNVVTQQIQAVITPKPRPTPVPAAEPLSPERIAIISDLKKILPVLNGTIKGARDKRTASKQAFARIAEVLGMDETSSKEAIKDRLVPYLDARYISGLSALFH